MAEGAVINTVETSPQDFISFQFGDQLIIIRRRECAREDMPVTAGVMSKKAWITLNVEEIGDTLVERYRQFRTTVR